MIDDLLSRHKGIQLLKPELKLIIQTIKKIKECNFLVFGLGNDSGMWTEVNKNGRTVFIEDYNEWFEKITKANPGIEAYLVKYPNNITQWKKILNEPEKLEMKLPPEISKSKWDVILVDGPAGWQMIEEFAGRMSSIYMAKKLVKKDGIVFVHDCDREVEIAYTKKYLGEKNFIKSVTGYSLLNMYKG